MFHSKWKKKALATFLTLIVPTAALGSEDYQQLITQARKGNMQPALTWFSQHPDLDENKLADWLQIASWSGQDKQVIEIYNRYQHKSLPLRGYAAVAKAYRNTQQWQHALNLWHALYEKDPVNKDYLRGEILTLADSGKYDVALEKIKALNQHALDNKNILIEAYIYKISGRYEDELLTITRAMSFSSALAPQSEQYLNALQNNFLPEAVLSRTDEHSVSPTVRVDAAAKLVRLSAMPTRTEKERYNIADRALALYEGMFKEWKDKPEYAASYQRARTDRLGALVSRERNKEAIAEYQRMTDEGLTLPEYARYWVATAYLKDHQPKQAEAIMSALFYQEDGEINTLSMEEKADLFYSHIESEHFTPAQVLTEKMVRSTPAYRSMQGSPAQLPNDEWLQGYQLMSSLARYGNDLPQAEKITYDLASKAPGNQGLRIDYASVLLARGLPRAAEDELKKAEVIEPANLTLEIEQAYTAMTLQEWNQAKLLTEDAVKRHPENEAVKRLQRANDIHQLSELRIGGSVGLDSEGPDSGKHDTSLSSVIYSPPLATNYRAFAGYGFSHSRFSEGKGNVRDWLGGVEWRSRDNWMEAELSGRNFNHKTKTGARVSGWHDFNDHWRIGYEGERLSRRTPLRAMKNDITANSGLINVRWYQNERREYGSSFSYLDFSDGNHRYEYSLEGKERIWTAPSLLVDVQPALYYGRNTKADTPYFNPEESFDIVGTVQANHLIWRNYDKSWTQEISGSVGNAWQKNYGNGMISQLSYGQRISWNDVADVGATLRWEKRPYDGEREHNVTVEFDMTFKF